MLNSGLLIYLLLLASTVANLVQYVVFDAFHGDTDDLVISEAMTSLMSLEVLISLVTCVASYIPLALDILFDYCQPLETISYSSFMPRREFFILIAIPELLILTVIIPLSQPDYLLGLLNARDSLLIYFQLCNLNNLAPEIFSTSIMCVTGTILLGSNLVNSYYFLMSLESYAISLNILLALAFIPLVFVCYRWISYLKTKKWTNWTKNDSMCTVYLVAFVGYILIDWYIVWFTPNLENDPLWGETTGAHFMCLYNCMLTFGSASMVVLFLRLARVDTRDIQESFEMRKAHVRYIAHEIRTPLNVMLTGLKVLEEGLERGDNVVDLKETVIDLRGSCVVAVDTLSDMLTFSKLEAKIMQLQTAEFVWKIFIKETIQLFRLQITAKEISLTVNFEDEELLARMYVQGDRHKLSQVLRNLVSNAIKFTPAHGTITVAVSKQQESTNSNSNGVTMSPTNVTSLPSSNIVMPEGTLSLLSIKVTDSGAGISQENQNKLFKDVIQFDPANLQGGGGSGLGLYISKGIMDLHGGGLTVFSAGEGAGSTFTMTLPCSRVRLVQDPIPEPVVVAIAVGTGAQSGAPVEQCSQRTGVNTDTVDHSVANNSPRASLDTWTSTPITQNTPRAGLFTSLTASVRRGPPSARLYASASMDTESAVDSRMDPDLDMDPYHSHSSVPRLGLHLPTLRQNRKLVSSILIVDDSEANRKMTMRLMQKRCSTCDVAGDGEVAVDKIRRSMQADGLNDHRRRGYDIVLMDFNMPRMDGPTAAKAMRDIGYPGLIIGLTGMASIETTNAFLSSGADHVFIKPLDVNKFDTLVDARERDTRA